MAFMHTNQNRKKWTVPPFPWSKYTFSTGTIDYLKWVHNQKGIELPAIKNKKTKKEYIESLCNWFDEQDKKLDFDDLNDIIKSKKCVPVDIGGDALDTFLNLVDEVQNPKKNEQDLKNEEDDDFVEVEAIGSDVKSNGDVQEQSEIMPDVIKVFENHNALSLLTKYPLLAKLRTVNEILFIKDYGDVGVLDYMDRLSLAAITDSLQNAKQQTIKHDPPPPAPQFFYPYHPYNFPPPAQDNNSCHKPPENAPSSNCDPVSQKNQKPIQREPTKQEIRDYMKFAQRIILSNKGKISSSKLRQSFANKVNNQRFRHVAGYTDDNGQKIYRPSKAISDSIKALSNIHLLTIEEEETPGTKPGIAYWSGVVQINSVSSAYNQCLMEKKCYKLYKYIKSNDVRNKECGGQVDWVEYAQKFDELNEIKFLLRDEKPNEWRPILRGLSNCD